MLYKIHYYNMFTILHSLFLFANMAGIILVMTQLQTKLSITEKLNKSNKYNKTHHLTYHPHYLLGNWILMIHVILKCIEIM